MWAYHGTEIQNLESIKDHGLVPRVPGDKIMWGTKALIFYSLNPQDAAEYAMFTGILIRFKEPRDGKQFFKDSPFRITYNKIPSSELDVFIGGVLPKRARLEELLQSKNWTNIRNYIKS